jgi:hypothetical protein
MWTRLVRAVFDPEADSRYLDRFGLLLLLTYAALAAQMLVNVEASYANRSQMIGNLVAQAVATAMLMLAIRACGLRARWRRSLTAVALVGLVGHTLTVVLLLSGQQTSKPLANVAPFGPLLLMTLTFLFVVYRLAQHRQVRLATLFASITAYLLIPQVFFYAFLVVNTLQTPPFFGRPASGSEFMYFSLTTVTTLGYGDPSPVTQFGQLLATTEALIGQLYLVVVVALIVGLVASNWGARKPVA